MRAIEGMKLVFRTLEVIEILNPPRWIIENPRGMLRKTGIMDRFQRWTVTYCQYGDVVQKPTDLWGVNPGWVPRPVCSPGDSCHESAVRGADTGTQNQNRSPALRAIVPLELWKEVLDPNSTIKKGSQLVLI